MTKTKVKIKKNDVVTLTIDDLAYGGQGVARLPESGYVVFVKEGVPGDTLEARIVKKKSAFAEAVIEKILEPSPQRIEPPCPLFHDCGGCSYLQIPYEAQLEYKQRQVAETLKRIGGLAAMPEVESIVPSPVEFRYRNKMDMTFGTNREGRITIGFHRRNDWRNILDVEVCLLEPAECDTIVSAIRDFANRSGRPAYDRHTHRGFWRHLIMRHSVETDETVAVLITSSQERFDFDALAKELHALCPRLKGFCWALNDLPSDVAQAEKIERTWGDPVLSERLDDLRFRISPFSFFQTNSRATEQLYATVLEYLELEPGHSLLDAYCGAGSIGIFCARRCRRVFGVDSIREAIWDARYNAQMNGIDNTTFVCGMVRRALPLIRAQAGVGGFDRMVVDPPRGGMHKKALGGLLELNVPLFVYVSCNPSTLARDMQTIAKAGYAPTRVRAVDLFPQTYHIESVIQFRKSR